MRDADLAHVYRELLVPIAEDYGPQLVLVSAGFDAHAADPIGGMALTSAGFAHLCSVVTAIAEGHCAGRLALFLEGGYDIAALGESVAACARVLAGEAASEPGGDAAGLTARMVLEARSLRERVLGGG